MLYFVFVEDRGGNSAVGVATGYRMDGSGFAPLCGRVIFSSPHPSKLEPVYPLVPGLFPEGVAAGALR